MKFYLKLLMSAGGAWTGRNYYQQYRAIENPEEVNPYGRLGAMLAAKDFESHQVGYGVYPSIRLIHFLFGNIGEQEIGRVFNSVEGQELLRQIRSEENHQKLGKMEYEYWKSQVGKGKTIGDRFMINFGASVDEKWRGYIQEGNAEIRELLNYFQAKNS